MEFMRRCWKTEFKREGSRHVGLSAFREEHTPSMYVSKKKEGHWVFCDHGSEAQGTIIDAVMAREGHQDVGLAIKTAKELAQDVGLLARSSPDPLSEFPPKGVETLLEKLSGNDPEVVRDYLMGRGLGGALVDEKIAGKEIMLNDYEESQYCCFAVRDGKGQLQMLFNRKIRGPADRNRFILGKQQVYCSDWDQIGKASRITICEAIIDALSIQTLQGGSCVLAIPGVNYDMERLPELPLEAERVEAFDDDRAGRGAAQQLAKRFPDHLITRFDLQGAGDVNERLCDETKMGSGQKLGLEQRVAIVMSGKPSREQGAISGVHHSRVCDIRKDAAEILAEVWGQRRPGPQGKPGPSPEALAHEKDQEALKRENERLQMRNDWLELELNMKNDQTEAQAHKKNTGRNHENDSAG